jgi:ABC-type polysaccharide/polyol phosphate transport system ATPase subunit
MSDIVVSNVSKRYWIRAGAGERHATRSLGLFSRREELLAIRNVSFRVERGEALGIVGQNGAGKSTILKLLSGITAPTAGEIAIRGRLSALVEISSGFHPELTGRENIFICGSILGMSRGEIASKVESIIEFSGVRRYIDVPVKRYSSGMSVRLGFSVAAYLEPDILLLDEVLAVGDAAFQAKCFDRIAELRNRKKTILFISHDLAALEALCPQALLLEGGELIMRDSSRAVIEEYMTRTFASLPTSTARPAVASGAAELISLEFAHPDGEAIRTGCSMITRLIYKASATVEDVTLSMSFYWPSGYLCAQFTTAGKLEPLTLRTGTGMIEFFCPTLAMQRGLYNVDVSIERDGEVIIRQPRCSVLRVDPGISVLGDFYMEHQVRHVGA